MASGRFTASTNASGEIERSASCARVATISSGSCANTARTSARSAALRCAPPEHTASLRSRVARLCFSSSMTSGLRDSTGYLTQILRAEDYSTGGAGRAEGRHHVPVQFQQHGGRVRGGHFEMVGGGEAAVFTRGELPIENNSIVRDDANARGGRSGDGKLQ